jgi:phosphate transport system ATP-binding protein
VRDKPRETSPRDMMTEETPEHVAPRGLPWLPEGFVDDERCKIQIKDLHAWFGLTEVLKGITLAILEHRVTAVIGPSGCGKSTLIRCLNRMHEVVRTARAHGRVLLDGQDIYDPRVNPVQLRQQVGMVFQKPNPFPTMSIRQNTLAGLHLQKIRPRNAEKVVETALRRAALWDEVKDILDRSGASLSGGQQQRLCIARALALEPEVLLMDEPCSALDPIATAKIEDLIQELRARYTVVIVTHNMQQASRVADYTAFLYLGTLIEYGRTKDLFMNPRDRRTEDYITGRFG